jgi:putative toxin-antitoxin system antitoxin component (TIGR02293 family)
MSKATTRSVPSEASRAASRFVTAARRRAANTQSRAWTEREQAVRLYYTSVVDRVSLVKAGVPAKYVKVLSTHMKMPMERFYRTLGLARPTVDRKVRLSKLLNPDESERVIGIARLVGQAENLVRESGGPREFDAATWVSAWLDRPLPALDGKRPGQFMDTADGRMLVADLLSQQQSGAYA